MVLEEIVKIFDGFLKITALVKDCFWYFYQWTLLISNYSGSSWNIVDERDLSKGVPWIVINIFLLSPLFRVLAFHTVNPLKYYVKIFPFVSFFEDNQMNIVMF